MNAPLTILCPFTRLDTMGAFWVYLGASDVPLSDSRLLAYVDSDDPRLEHAVRQGARSIGLELGYHCSGLWTPTDNIGPVRRRRRHSLMRQATQKLLEGSGALLLLEDDTLVPENVYSLLTETQREHEALWVCGAEVGRWGRSRPPGIWRINTDANGEAVRKESFLPGSESVERVDGTGLYCVLTECEVYRRLEFSHWSDAIGLDTHATWRLSQSGVRLMVDWRVECIHVASDGSYLTMSEAQVYSRPISAQERSRETHVSLEAEMQQQLALSRRRTT